MALRQLPHTPAPGKRPRALGFGGFGPAGVGASELVCLTFNVCVFFCYFYFFDIRQYILLACCTYICRCRCLSPLSDALSPSLFSFCLSLSLPLYAHICRCTDAQACNRNDRQSDPATSCNKRLCIPLTPVNEQVLFSRPGSIYVKAKGLCQGAMVSEVRGKSQETMIFLGSCQIIGSPTQQESCEEPCSA